MSDSKVLVTFSIFSLVCLYSLVSPDEAKKFKLIIVGGGASGIAAAAKLISNGFEDFIILEAEDRIGGRVNTVPYGENSFIDMGAQWVHGQNRNVVFEMAQPYNMTEVAGYGSLSNGNIKYFHSSHKIIDENAANEIINLINEYLDDNEDLVKHNKSAGDYVTKRLKLELTKNKELKNLANDSVVDELLDFFGKATNSLEGSDSWFDISTRGVALYDDLEGSTATIWKTGGYSNVFKLLLKQMPGQTPIILDSKLKLSKEVNRIDWSDENQVKVACSDGSEYSADKVLITVSLGVLKNRTDFFSPSLPEWKKNAIDRINFGTVDKVFIQFADQWWPGGDFTGFSFIWDDKDQMTLFKDIGGPNNKPWITQLYGFYLTTPDPKTFLGWMTGPTARYMETLSLDQIKKDLKRVFQFFLGSNYTISEPTKVIISKWGTDNHFLGSYSTPSLVANQFNANRSELAKPVHNSKGEPTLFFGGEATNEFHYGTVNGAVETGWREADRLINLKSE